jgi:hypothetical protein
MAVLVPLDCPILAAPMLTVHRKWHTGSRCLTDLQMLEASVPGGPRWSMLSSSSPSKPLLYMLTLRSWLLVSFPVSFSHYFAIFTSLYATHLTALSKSLKSLYFLLLRSFLHTKLLSTCAIKSSNAIQYADACTISMLSTRVPPTASVDIQYKRRQYS